MFWCQVIIEKEKSLADVEKTEFIRRYDAAFRTAGVPEGAKLYHLEKETGGHIFCLNPAAASLAKEVLPDFQFTECQRVPDLDGFQLVRFR
jgi:hypothetical protein